MTEADYTRDGYTSTSTGATGSILADNLQIASFTNTLSSAPDKPGTPGDPVDYIDDGDTPQGSADADKDGMPQTGDDQSNELAKFGLLFFSIALMALTAADFTLRKKYFRLRKQK